MLLGDAIDEFAVKVIIEANEVHHENVATNGDSTKNELSVEHRDEMGNEIIGCTVAII